MLDLSEIGQIVSSGGTDLYSAAEALLPSNISLKNQFDSAPIEAVITMIFFYFSRESGQVYDLTVSTLFTAII
jgi:hypothetical protein